MSEFIENAEVEQENYETPDVDENESGSESDETETEQVEPKVEEKEYPWKEKKTPEQIPYGRFKEVNERKKELETRLAEYETRLRSFEESQNKVKEIGSVEELNAAMSELSIEEYNAHLINLARKSFEAEQSKKEEKSRIEKIETDIREAVSSKIEKAQERIPEIKEAVTYLNQYADYISPEARYAMLTDDNAAEVMFEIATDAALLEFIIKANPIDVQRKIARISAKYDNAPIVNKPAKVEAFVPKTPVGSPKTAGNMAAPGKRKYSDSEVAKMTGAEYRKAKTEGRI